MRLDALRAIALAAVCAALPGLGCTATATAEPAPQIITTGRLTLAWTINGSIDPNLCYQSQVANINIRIFYADGTFDREYVAECTAFATTIDLPDGQYSGTAELIDGSNNPRTSAVNIDLFAIVGGTNLNIQVDFPSSSFF